MVGEIRFLFAFEMRGVVVNDHKKKMLASTNKAFLWLHGTHGKEDFCKMVPYYQGTPTVKSYVPAGLVEPL